MDGTEVRQIVEENLAPLREALWLHDWSITVEYGPTGHERWAASCDRAGGDYNTATITIDPYRHEDKHAVLKSLTHELVHVALGRMDTYRNIVTSLIPESAETAAAEQVAWTHAIEQTVVRLTNAFMGALFEEEAEEPDSGLSD